MAEFRSATGCVSGCGCKPSRSVGIAENIVDRKWKSESRFATRVSRGGGDTDKFFTFRSLGGVPVCRARRKDFDPVQLIRLSTERPVQPNAVGRPGGRIGKLWWVGDGRQIHWGDGSSAAGTSSARRRSPYAARSRIAGRPAAIRAAPATAAAVGRCADIDAGIGIIENRISGQRNALRRDDDSLSLIAGNQVIHHFRAWSSDGHSVTTVVVERVAENDQIGTVGSESGIVVGDELIVANRVAVAAYGHGSVCVLSESVSYKGIVIAGTGEFHRIPVFR